LAITSGAKHVMVLKPLSAQIPQRPPLEASQTVKKGAKK
jgi:hypothetical protein